MSAKKFVVRTFVLLGMIFFGIILLVVVVDPYFHYHKPIKGLSYKLNNEYYQNDGILKHFDYSAVITGTSMQENIKTSEVESLFQEKSVKVCFSGGTAELITKNLKTAFQSENKVSLVIRGISDGGMMDDVLFKTYPDPEYLYDHQFFNDINYWFNKDVLIRDIFYGTLLNSLSGKKSTTFDEYSNWTQSSVFDKESVIENYKELYYKDALVLKENTSLTLEEKEEMRQKIQKHLVSLAEEHPETEFIYYLNPYSILFFCRMNTEGNLQKVLGEWRYLAEILSNYENIHLFCFYDETQMITDLNNYKDYVHHSEKINSQILQWIASGEHEVTGENYKEYFDALEEYYGNYEYERIFEK